jgi:hypothetical protein
MRALKIAAVLSTDQKSDATVPSPWGEGQGEGSRETNSISAGNRTGVAPNAMKAKAVRIFFRRLFSGT